MSWLSSLFGGGGEDPLAVRQREEGNARLAAQRAAEEAQRQRDFEAQQQQAQMAYLEQLRADQQAAEAAAAAKDPTATRQAAQTALSGYFTPEFEQGLVPGTITDPLEQAVFGEQRGAADEYLNRLLKRGVITEGGRTAAAANLEEQAPRVRQQLQDISNTILGGERSKLADIAGRGRERASTLNVGEAFDIAPYKTAAESELGTFTSGLSDLFKSQVPSNLFDTSALGSIAGGAQFAGNRPFAPEVTAGVAAPTEETDPFTGQKPVQKRTSTVF
jgi:hypothetical protein